MTAVSGKVRVNRPYFFTDTDGGRAEFPAFGYGAAELAGNQLREFQMYVDARQIEALVAEAPSNDEPPSITGTAQVGETLTGDPGEWSGSAPITLTYEWLLDDVAIEGATGLTYLVDVEDIGGVVTFAVTATNGLGSTTETSDPTAEVIAAVAPTNDTPAVIAGDAEVGATLTIDDAGIWDGGPAPVLSWEWQISDDGEGGWTDIDGETGEEYEVVADDEGKYIRVLETATNVAGSDSEPSNVIGPITTA